MFYIDKTMKMTWLQYVVVMVILCCFHMEADSVTDEQFRGLASVVGRLQAENDVLRADMEQLRTNERKLQDQVERFSDIIVKITDSGEGLVQNMTIEERVAVLETQVVEIEEDIADLDEDVNFLFDETVIQDERLLNLEEETNIIDEEVEVLKDTTTQLEGRVTVLEENGGSGNSSVAELEMRVETLENTVSGQEKRLNATEDAVEDVQGITSELDTRLTVAEENIQGLIVTDVTLDARVTALEESGGGSQNGTIAFYAALTSYDVIDIGDTVEFNEVLINEGDGYNSATGVFTVPDGGDGVYYFSCFLDVSLSEFTRFDMELNNGVICSGEGDMNSNGLSDQVQATCSVVVDVAVGDQVQVVIINADDNTPLEAITSNLFNGFNGFRI